jgi:hypothetical protein
LLAAKTYLDAITEKLNTDAAKDLAATIMPVETQHIAVFRSVLIVVLKSVGLNGNARLVLFAFLDDQPTPPKPEA